MTALPALVTTREYTDPPTVTPLDARDITGTRTAVLAEFAGYMDRGELVRYDAPTELADRTVTVRVYLRPVPTQALPPTLVPGVPTETYPAKRRWDAESISAVGLLSLVAVLLTVVYLSVAALEVVAIVVGGAIVFGGLFLLGSAVRGGGDCPGIRIHCGGCK